MKGSDDHLFSCARSMPKGKTAPTMISAFRLWLSHVRGTLIDARRYAGWPPFMIKPRPFKWFKMSPKIIPLAVMLYVRIPLSLHNAEEWLHERGIDICDETV
jgi:hypothetical protein